MDYVNYDEIAGEPEKSSWDDAIDQFLDQSRHNEQERLEQELEQIAEQLDHRDEIHTAIVDELEWKLQQYTKRLKRLYRQGRDQDEKQQRLKDRIEEFSRELREEHREHWRDRQQLERERRDILQALDELDEDVLSELELL